MTNINIETLKANFPKDCLLSLENDLFVADISYQSGLEKKVQYPFRFDGYFLIFCQSGHMTMSIDMKDYALSKDSLTISLPKNILNLNIDSGYQGEIHFIVIALSKKWVSRLQINASEMFSRGFSTVYIPSIKLDSAEIEIAKNYYKIFVETLASKKKYMTDALATLTSALFYEVAGSWVERINSVESPSVETSRNSIKIFNNFVALVTKYHTEERSVAFYADKLCISPKHLARVIKEVSGQTPTQSIDNFVVMEAKNMLLYTDLSVKEIAEQLHFTNQTIFYRFFKRNTGIHPTEFRKVSR